MGKSHEIPQIDPLQATVTERLGISDEVYAQGSILAAHWVGAIDALTEPKKADLLSTLEASAHAMPKLPQDHNGRVLPRIEYAAKHIIYETHEFGEAIRSLIEGSNSRVTPNFEQMETVLADLMEAYDNNMPPFNYPDTMTPQDPRNMPKTPFVDGRQEANFYLTSCLWMRRGNSVAAMRQLGELFDNTRDWHQDPFDPDIASQMSDEQILAMLQPYSRLQMRDFTVPGWRHNAHQLVQHFGGDARNIIDDTESYDVILKRMSNKLPRKKREDGQETPPDAGFEGFKKKMTSMFLYYMIDADLKTYFDFPLPVDIHVARLATGCEFVSFQGFEPGSNHMTEKLQDTLRDMLYDYSLTTGRSQMDVCNAIWLVGAFSCSSSPETQSTKILMDGRRSLFGHYEPNYGHDVKGRQSKDLSRYLATCGVCSIERYCKMTSRGRENQTLGRMTPHMRRIVGAVDLSLIPIETMKGDVRRRKKPNPSKKKREILDHPVLFDAAPLSVDALAATITQAREEAEPDE